MAKIDQESLSKGILLVAFGKKYWCMAKVIIKDLKNISDLPIALYTDCPHPIQDVIMLHPEVEMTKDYECKIHGMLSTPFRHNLYIDVDSRVLLKLDNIFRILENYDIALPLADGNRTLINLEKNNNDFCIPLNTSTVLFRKTRKIERLFNAWLDLYKKNSLYPGRGDQMYLAHVIYYSDLRNATLPNLFKFNTHRFFEVNGPIYILTGLVTDIKTILSQRELNEIFNSTDGRRKISVSRLTLTKKTNISRKILRTNEGIYKIKVQLK